MAGGVEVKHNNLGGSPVVESGVVTGNRSLTTTIDMQPTHMHVSAYVPLTTLNPAL